MKRPQIGYMVAAVLLGWPFVGLMALPMGVALLLRFDLLRLIIVTIEWCILIGVPVVVADSVMYGKAVLAPLNIAVYNLFGGQGGGSQLYGTVSRSAPIASVFVSFRFVLF